MTGATPGQTGALSLALDSVRRRLRISHGGMTTITQWPAGSAMDVLAADGAIADLLADGVPGIPQPGETIFAQGASASHAVIVLDGMVKRARVRADGTTTLLDFCGPGSMLGLLEALAPGLQHQMTSIAGSHDVLTWLIPADRLRSTLAGPQTGPALLRIIGDGHAREICSRADQRLPAAPRLARLLADLAAQFGRAEPDGLKIGDLSQTELSAATGLSEASVERLLRTWREQAIIDTRYRRFTILSPERLLEAADQQAAAPAGPGRRESRI